MKATRPLLLLALLALFGSCSKATDEPVVPNSGANDQTLTLDLSGEIEVPNVAPQTLRNLLLTEGTSFSGKRIITPYFNDNQLPAVLCIYDDFGTYSLSRVNISVFPATSRNGKTVNRFRYYGTLDQRKFKKRWKESGDNSAVQYKPDADNAGVYVSLFIGLNPNGGEDTMLDIQEGETSILYNHGQNETKLGAGIDYQDQGPNRLATRLIFATSGERIGKEKVIVGGKEVVRDLYEHHPMNFAATGATADKSDHRGNANTRGHVLSASDLKIRLRGALVEVTVENAGYADVRVSGVRVGGFGGHTAAFVAPTAKQITRTSTQGQKYSGWVVDTPPTIMPVSGRDKVGKMLGSVDEFDIKFDFPVSLPKKDTQTGAIHKMSKIVYLPFVNSISGKSNSGYGGSMTVVYAQEAGDTAEKPVTHNLNPLKQQGILVSRTFTIN